MSASHVHDDAPERRAAGSPRHDRSAGAGDAHAETHAPAGPADPRLAHVGAAVPGLFALQRSAGNAAVASMVGSEPAIQRAVEIGEMTTSASAHEPAEGLSPETAAQVRAALPGMLADVQQELAGGAASPTAAEAPGAAGAAAGGAASPTAADAPGAAGAAAGGVTSDGGTTTVTGGVVNISGGAVNIDAAMTHASGVVQADTVIANSVVASSYTPGAGNTW